MRLQFEFQGREGEEKICRQPTWCSGRHSLCDFKGCLLELGPGEKWRVGGMRFRQWISAALTGNLGMEGTTIWEKVVIEGKEMNIGCFHAKVVVNCGILNIEMHKFLSYQVHIYIPHGVVSLNNTYLWKKWRYSKGTLATFFYLPQYCNSRHPVN